MSVEKIRSLVELANNRLNSSEDFEQFQTFVTQELDLETVSNKSYLFIYIFFYHNPLSIIAILCVYNNIICPADSMTLCKISQLVIKDYIYDLKLKIYINWTTLGLWWCGWDSFHQNCTLPFLAKQNNGIFTVFYKFINVLKLTHIIVIID